jgi:hypothetical protein
MSLDPRKAFASVVCIVILGAQIAAMIPPEGLKPRQPKFWPFVNYPMYATARHAGDVFRVPELRAYPCDGGEPVTLPDTSLRIPRFEFWDLLDRVANPRPGAGGAAPDPMSDKSVRLVTRLIASAAPGRFCRAEVRQRDYVMGSEGWDPAKDPPVRTMRTWSLLP